MNKNKDKVCVFVDSFDGYSFLWNTFFDIFNKYWADCPYPIYLVNNEKKINYKNVEIINTGIEINWFNRTLKALKQIESDYIIFFLEDYFIGKKVDNSLIEQAVEFVIDNKINFYKFVDTPKTKQTYKDIPYLGKIESNQRYAINGALAIWKRDYFIEVLENVVDGKTAWDFEVFYANNSNNVKEKIDFDLMCSDKRDLFTYQNGLLKGKWIRKTLKHFKKNDVIIDTMGKEIMNFKETIIYNLQQSIPDNTFIYKILKNIMKQFGFKFMTK